MAESNDYRINIDVSAKNVQGILSELERIQSVLDQMAAGEFPIAGDVEATTRAVQSMSDMFERAKSNVSDLSGEFSKLKAELAAAESEFTKLNQAAVVEGSDGKGQDLLGRYSDEQKAKILATANALETTLVGALRTAESDSKRLTTAQEGLNRAFEDASIAQAAQGMDRVEKATLGLAVAQERLEQAQGKVSAAEDPATRTAALKEAEQARKTLTSAETELAAATEAAANKRVASQEKVAAAEERNAAAMRAGNYDQRVQEVGRLAASSERYTAALERVRVAQDSLTAAQKSGDPDRIAKATDAHTKALTESNAAYKEHRSAAAQDQAATEREAKAKVDAANKMTESERKLSAARDKRDAAAAGTEEGQLTAARDRVEAATQAVAQAEERLSQARASGNESNILAANASLTRSYDEQAAAISQANRAQQEIVNEMPRLRYAMYDVSRTATMAGAALLAYPTAVAGVFGSMENSFAGVSRTTQTYLDETGAATRDLRDSFNELYGAIPSDWGALTEIGTLAGQMNIAADDTARFTDLVAKFSSTSSVGVEESATAFGRLSELLNVASSDYENLGSSILAAGINSVATESQIIQISQQIAGIGGTAGLSADEVIGLSSALASIGTAPELSRGVVTRLFTKIMTATSEGGESLEAFARVSGMSAQEFATAWGDDAAGAVQSLMEGLGQLSGSDAIQTLGELGINSVRDVPAILKLSQNYELLADSLNIASEGYREGSLLQEQYDVTSQTLIARLTVLKNNFALFLSTLGESAKAFRPVIDAASEFVQMLTRVASSGVGQVFSAFAMAVTAVGGALLLTVGGFATAYGGSLALKTVMIQLTETLQRNKAVAEANAASTRSLAAAQGSAAAAATSHNAAASANSFRSLGKGLASAAGSAGILTTALKGLALTTGIGIAVTAAVALADALMNADEAAESLFTDMPDLGAALKADTAEFEKTGEAFRTVQIAVEDTADSGDVMSESFARITGVSGDTEGALDKVADASGRVTVAIGEQTVAALTNAIVTNDEFMDSLRANADELDRFGFNIGEYIGSIATGDADQYIDKITAKMSQWNLAEQERLLSSAETSDEMARVLDLQRQKYQDLTDITNQLSGSNSQLASEIDKVNLASEIRSGVAKALNVDLEQQDKIVQDLKASLTDMFPDLDTSAADTQAAFEGLAKSLIEGGGAMDIYSEQGRASIGALDGALNQLWDQADGNAQVFGTNLANVFAFVEGAGSSLGAEADYLRQIMVDAFNQEYGIALDTSDARGSIQEFINLAIEALKVRAELERSQFDTKMKNFANIGTSPGAIKAYQDQQKAFQDSQREIDKQVASLERLQKSLNETGNHGRDAGNRIRKAMNDAGGGARNAGNDTKKAAKDAKKAADDMKEVVYTLTDYANDLSSVWERAFEIRFSGQQTFDQITTAVKSMADRFEEAQQRVRDLKLELRSLKADLGTLQAELSVQQYYLSIAVDYGDTARAEQIQARIAELNAEVAEKQADVTKTSKDLSKAQGETSRSLTGNSEAAIKNRQDLAGLVQEYQDHIKALAASGLSSDELKRKTEQLRQDFVKQATQMGFNRGEIKKYEKAFEDITYTISKVPRKITVKANMNPATQAFNEWLKKNKNKSITVKTKATTPKIGNISGGAYRPSSVSVGSGGMWTPFIQATTMGVDRTKWTPPGINRVVSTGGFMGHSGVQYKASGGVLGLHPGRPRGTDTIPAWLTPGEYVVRKQATDYYGKSTMQDLNRMKIPRSALQGGGGQTVIVQAPSAPGTVDLSARTIQAIANAVQPYLKVGDNVIAGASNRYATSGTQLGRG